MRMELMNGWRVRKAHGESQIGNGKQLVNGFGLRIGGCEPLRRCVRRSQVQVWYRTNMFSCRSYVENPVGFAASARLLNQAG